MPTRNNSPERDNRSGIEFVGTKSESMQDYYTRCPNRWASIRDTIREPAAEMLGTMVLMMFGNGAICQVVLGGSTKVVSAPKGDWLSLNTGWAVGGALGVWICGGISGGHINPVVTICSALFRKFPWKKVPLYILGQLLGAYFGSLFVYANYAHAIDLFEGGRGIRTVPGTASLFSSYAAPYMTAGNCFFDEFLGTFLLLIVVWAVTDPHNGPPPAGLIPLVVFFLILGIGATFGMQTGHSKSLTPGYAVNPARDLGPRLMTFTVGYGSEVFKYRNQYWFWCTILGPLFGGIFACFLYDSFLYVGQDSFINRPSENARQYLGGANPKHESVSQSTVLDAV
ncbi:aquaporin [Lactarius psammicola]|nr:aquaporin [Lactarius psammicola]